MGHFGHSTRLSLGTLALPKKLLFAKYACRLVHKFFVCSFYFLKMTKLEFREVREAKAFIFVSGRQCETARVGTIAEEKRIIFEWVFANIKHVIEIAIKQSGGTAIN